MSQLIVSFDLDGAVESSSLSKRSLQYAIENDLLVVHYGGPGNTKPLILPEDLKAYIRSLPTHRPAKKT